MNSEHSPREGSRAARDLLSGDGVGGPPASLGRNTRRAVSWINFRPLWESRNDRVARLLGDPTDALRQRWMQWLRSQGGDEDPAVREQAGRDRITVAIIGDPGEGDLSQAVVVPPLLAVQEQCDFLVVCSDVVYPAGDVNQYAGKFYEPYEEWGKPIYALPGNHDWYGELEGFMFHFCGVDPPPAGFGDDPPRPLLWRRARARQNEARELRDRRPPGRSGFQPAPYFVIDAGPIALVCIDTGIQGDLDRAQGDWLIRVSRTVPKPKVLLTGKPLIVDGSYRPGRIASLDRTVDDIVRDPAHGYVAAIGGDIHNYQRYPVKVRERRIEYIVSGGGGAFMHATHRIPRVDLGGIDESRFRCFPLRGDSLWLYSRVVLRALTRLVITAALFLLLSLVLVGAVTLLLATQGAQLSTWILAELLPALFLLASGLFLRQIYESGAIGVLRVRGKGLTRAEAATWMAGVIGEEPVLEHLTVLSPEGEAVAEFVAPRFHHTGGFLHSFFSEIFDVDQPPLYKQFLRLDADRDRLQITCCAAIGAEEEAHRPYIEEWTEIPLAPARHEMASSTRTGAVG